MCTFLFILHIHWEVWLSRFAHPGLWLFLLLIGVFSSRIYIADFRRDSVFTYFGKRRDTEHLSEAEKGQHLPQTAPPLEDTQLFLRPLLLSRTLSCFRDLSFFRRHLHRENSHAPNRPEVYSFSETSAPLSEGHLHPENSHAPDSSAPFQRLPLLSTTPPPWELPCSRPSWGPLLSRDSRSEQDS